jgi:pullulanase/glycogen debranching enzyme
MKEYQDKLNDFLDDLQERAVATAEKGNQVGAAYLAMLCGMWCDTFHQNKNRFINDTHGLYGWFLSGFNASKDAIQMNEMERVKRERFEKTITKIKAENEAKKNKENRKSFFSLK